jgi:isopentenyl-diphosphate delta-isomerase
LIALESGGRERAIQMLLGIEAELKTALLLTGQRSCSTLKNTKRVVSGELKDWLEQG